jgi:polynucleotide 5'-hydroxyl-kinase GRC3/NOL9
VAPDAPLDLSPVWREAIARAAEAERVAVLGPTDAGKSAFIRTMAEAREDLRLIDLDPGQKMVGPPGTASLGRWSADGPLLERFVFLGSTSVGSFRALAQAAAALGEAAERRFVANTSGYVGGPGAAMQGMTLAALKPDLVVCIGEAPALEPVLARWPGAVRLQRSPLATRKTEGFRRAVRQRAFAEALEGASVQVLAGTGFVPEPPAAFVSDARPVCALADAGGEDLELGLLLGWDSGGANVLARGASRPVAALRLGKMWAQPHGEGWKLLDRLSPAWEPPPQALSPTSSP